MPASAGDRGLVGAGTGYRGGAWEPRDFEASHPTTAEQLIEFVDASLSLDREVKTTLYARAGVYGSRSVAREGDIVSALCGEGKAIAVSSADRIARRRAWGGLAS